MKIIFWYRPEDDYEKRKQKLWKRIKEEIRKQKSQGGQQHEKH